MERFKELLFKIFRPRLSVVILLAAVSAAMLLYSFCHPKAIAVICYLSYFVSAYSLTAVCFRIPDMIRAVGAATEKSRRISLYRSDAALRVKISLYLSTTVNLAYALMQFYLGIINRSVWFYALAVYYALLTAMRLLLLRHARKNKAGEGLRSEFIRYRICGILLGIMNIALAVVVFYIVQQNRGFEHGEIVTISMATYTFLTLTVSIIGIVKYRKYESPVMSASKAVSLAAASVSLLSLETAMITAFGQDTDPLFRKTITASTGSVVCVFILLMATYMIIRATKELKRLKAKGK